VRLWTENRVYKGLDDEEYAHLERLRSVQEEQVLVYLSGIPV
jgi:uncharacterized protein YciI